MAMTLTPPTPGGSPLDRFRVFYGAVAEARQRLEGGAWPPLDSGGALQTVQAPLLALLDRLAAEAEADQAADPWTERQNRYLMTTFADDVFGRPDSPMSEAWRDSSLESQLFQTDTGADTVFERIDALLGVADPGRRGLARAYLLALALGFRGRYDDDPQGNLGRYREALLAFAVPAAAAGGAPAATEGDAAPTVSPQAYRHTIGPTPGKLLPNVQRWAVAAVAIVLLVGVLSIPLWRDATRSLGVVVERVLNR